MTDLGPDRRLPWWAPARYAARRRHLEARMAVVRAVRRFFEVRGFAEVETPALQISPGMEPHLVAFETEIKEPLAAASSRRLYLHTSPEFAMKKLLAAGEPRLYQIARVWRNGERSATHHPEFSMLEWYRAGAAYRDLMADCEALLRTVFEAVQVALRGAPDAFVWRGARSAPAADWRYVTVAEAFDRHSGIDLLATAGEEAGALREEAMRIGIRTGERDSWEDVFFRIFLDRIEPHLGIDAPTILYDYPVSMAALARPHPTDPRLAERFELYVAGLELANGFSELTDAAEQRRRFEADQARKRALFGYDYPIDEDFLAALEAGLPESAGIALGLDRLVMLATGAERIEDVLWAPVA